MSLGIIGRLVVVATLAAVTSCGSSPTAPINPPVAVQTSLTITGNLSFTGVAQAGQLTATAGYSDGTTKNITSSVTWTVLIETVAAISPTGMLTTTGLGATFVYMQNNSVASSSPLFFRSMVVTVTPPGTLALFGWTREPGSGPISGVRVLDPLSGQSTVSNNDGNYAMGGLTSAALAFSKAGYEEAQFETASGAFDGWPLQQVVRLEAGASVSQKLAPHDVDYLVASGTHCQPCRLVRVTSAAAGTLRLRVTWTDAGSTLNLWVNGQVYPGSGAAQEIVADVPVGVGELLVYVGKMASDVTGNYVPFTLATTR